MKKRVMIPSLCFAVLSTAAFVETVQAAEPLSIVNSQKTMYVKVDTGSTLNQRSSASTSAKIVGRLAKGTEVTVLSYSNGWSKIKASGKTGYVSSKYLTSTQPSGSKPRTTIPSKLSPSAKMVTKYIAVDFGSTLNMRSSASINGTIVGKLLAKGTKVTVLSESMGWSKIKANGKTGYVSSKYLTGAKPSGSKPETTKPPKPTAPAKTVTKYVTVDSGSTLNMRSSASTSATIVGKLVKGTEVSVLSESNGWSKIKASGKTGYVSSKYLTGAKPSGSKSETTKPSKPTPPAKTVTKYVAVDTGSTLNMRSSASTAAMIIGKLTKGTEVTVLSESNGWSKIKASGKTGYVSSKYLTGAKPSGSTPEPNTPPKTTPPAKTVTKYVAVDTGSTLNMRSSASTTATIVGKLTKGTKVIVLSESNGWSKINAGGKTGYVSSEFLTVGSNVITPKTKYVNIASVSGISMYTKPSTDASIIINIAKGVPVLVYSEAGGWSKIKVYEEEGYVKTELLSDKKPVDNIGENDDKDSSNSSDNTQGTIKYVDVDAGSNLNMRSSASISGTIITKLTKGTAVKVLSESNGWAKVTANGKTGYVNAQYLTLDSKELQNQENVSKTYTYSNYNLTLEDMVEIQMDAKAQTDNQYRTYIRGDALKLNSSSNPSVGTVQGNGWNLRGGAGTNFWTVEQVNNGTQLNIVSSVKGSDGYIWYQVDSNQTWVNASPEDVKYYVDPSNFVNDPIKSFQFIDLSKSTKLQIAEVNNRVLSGKGILIGKAAAFLAAGESLGINEIYLISHALLETGNGTSTLANGVKVNGKTVYNMYGIGAYDGDAVASGAQFAYNAGWFTPEAAIIGGAQFIANGYINNGQNTLYKMRWNPDGVVNVGQATHQYATDIGWAEKQILQINNLYSLVSSYSLIYDIPVYREL